MEQLAEISFEIDISKAKWVSSSLIEKILKDPKTSNVTQKAVFDCKLYYSYAVVELETGLEAIKAGNYVRAMVSADSAMRRGKDCHFGLRKNMAGISKLVWQNNNFMNLTAISASFYLEE